MWYTINSLIMRAKASKRRAKGEQKASKKRADAGEGEQMRTNANEKKEKCSQKLQNTRTEDSGGCLVVSASFVLCLR